MINLARLYNDTIRDYLPRKENVLQGEVKAKQARLLDANVDDPGYEEELINAVKIMVTSGDTVVIIGGGWGVSAYFAAKLADRVIVYEGSDRQLGYLRETMHMNDGTDNIDVRPGYVCGSGELYSRGNGVETIEITDIPDADMYVIDAEGGECDILPMIELRDKQPPKIIVESHPQYGCRSNYVEHWLRDNGYSWFSDKHDQGHVFSARR